MRITAQRIQTGVLVSIAIAIAVAALLLLPGQYSPASAEGGGCADADVTGIGDDPLASYDASPDIVTAVCIKSGIYMFDGGHSGQLGNGTYENGCYEVSGVGTSTVTVERIGAASSTCQAISHIDVYTGPPPPTPTPTPTSAPPEGSSEATPTATVLGAIQEPEEEEPQALPETGAAPDGGSGGYLPLLLALGGLTLLGGAGSFAVAAARRRR